MTHSLPSLRGAKRCSNPCVAIHRIVSPRLLLTSPEDRRQRKFVARIAQSLERGHEASIPPRHDAPCPAPRPRTTPFSGNSSATPRRPGISSTSTCSVLLRALCDLVTLRLESASFIEPALCPACPDIFYSLIRFTPTLTAPAGRRTSPIPKRRALYGNPFPLVDITAIPDDGILRHKRIALLKLVRKHIWQRGLVELLEPLSHLPRIAHATDEQLESLLNYMLQAGNTADPRGSSNGWYGYRPTNTRRR